MAKQTFTTGQVLTAAQMTSLQQTAMLGGDANARTASYVLVAGDAGNAVSMNSSSPTTITVNNSIFAAGDIVTIINLGTGICTITAGTATVATSGSLALAQNQGGVLRFTSASAAIFFQFATPASGDIEGVTAGTGISGGGTSGTVTITNSMATAIDAKGDLIVGTGADTFDRLAVGTNGHTLVADSSTATGLKWQAPSSGAATFKLAKYFSFSVRGLAYGNSTWIVYGSSGNLETSTDGVTWTARTSGFGVQNINSVVYGNGIWVAVGSNGTISTSTDLATWTTRTSNVSTNNLITVKYINSNFVAVGSGANGGTGGITTSSDGITWTKRNTPGTANATTLYDVNFGNGYYVTVGTGSGSTTNMYYSTDLSTWTAQASTGASLYGCFYDQGNWILLPSSGSSVVYRATNPAGAFTALTQFFWYLGLTSSANCYAVRNNILYYFSPDWNYCMANNTTINTTDFVFAEYKTPITLPMYQTTAGFGSGSPMNNSTGIVFDNNGKMAVLDSSARRVYIQE